MLAVSIVMIIIWIVMWGFYKFMYPRAPKSMMPKKGDVTTPRNCNYCGNSLAEYRGVLENDVRAKESVIDDVDNKTINQLFFCNYEHQADFHAGKVYK